MVQQERNTHNGAWEKRERSEGGIKIFAGGPLPERDITLQLLHSVTPDILREEQKVWRPEETLDAADILFTHNRVNAIGGPQVGKGTIVFGISELLERWGVGYMFIDGHYQETTGDEVSAKINQANQKGIPILFDSADYLFAKSRATIRNVTAAHQFERTPKIIDALTMVDVPVALTTHDEQWAQTNLNISYPSEVGEFLHQYPDVTFPKGAKWEKLPAQVEYLMQTYKVSAEHATVIAKVLITADPRKNIYRSDFNETLSEFPIYQIPAELQSEASIQRFLKDHKVTDEQAETYTALKKIPYFQTLLVNAVGDKRRVERIFYEMTTFPVLKTLTRDRQQEFMLRLQWLTQELSNSEVPTEKLTDQIFLQLAKMVEEAGHERVQLTNLRKMAPVDKSKQYQR